MDWIRKNKKGSENKYMYVWEIFTLQSRTLQKNSIYKLAKIKGAN